VLQFILRDAITLAAQEAKMKRRAPKITTRHVPQLQGPPRQRQKCDDEQRQSAVRCSGLSNDIDAAVMAFWERLAIEAPGGGTIMNGLDTAVALGAVTGKFLGLISDKDKRDDCLNAHQKAVEQWQKEENHGSTSIH
jgi:hypothetical protein